MFLRKIYIIVTFNLFFNVGLAQDIADSLYEARKELQKKVFFPRDLQQDLKSGFLIITAENSGCNKKTKVTPILYSNHKFYYNNENRLNQAFSNIKLQKNKIYMFIFNFNIRGETPIFLFNDSQYEGHMIITKPINITISPPIP